MNHRLHTTTIAGFSLIELMITIGIVVLVTGIALVRYGSFNNAILLRSQAFEIALDIRQAQQYAISASTFTGDDRSAFGMYFDMAQTGTYMLYQDKPTNNNYYNSGEQIGAANLIDSRFRITSICFNGAVPPCSGNAKVSVSFKRPNFDAKIYNQTGAPTSVNQVDIVLTPVSGGGTSQRTISVFTSGQISVK